MATHPVDQWVVTKILGSLAITLDPVMVTAVPWEIKSPAPGTEGEPLWSGWQTPMSDRVWLPTRVLPLDKHHPEVHPVTMGAGVTLTTMYPEGQEDLAQAGVLPDLTGLRETLASYDVLELPH